MNGDMQKDGAAAIDASPEQKGSFATAETSPSRWRLSLRAKGYVVFAGLIAYAVALIWFVASERGRLLTQFRELEVVVQQEEQLSRLNVTLSNASFAVSGSIYAGPVEARGLSIAIEPVLTAAQQLSRQSPVLDNGIGELRRRLEELRSDVSRGNVIDLRTALIGLIGDLEMLSDEVQARRVELSAGYRKMYDSVTLMSMVFGILGLVVFGALITLFFARLAADIRELSHRAREIVMGYRGAPIAVIRASLYRKLEEYERDGIKVAPARNPLEHTA